jgi:hypothetical protein
MWSGRRAATCAGGRSGDRFRGEWWYNRAK